MSEWVKEGKFEQTDQLHEDDRRRALADYTFDSIEVEDFLNDPRLFALAHIKFMNGEDQEREVQQGVDQIKEMVAYLLNGKEDDENV